MAIDIDRSIQGAERQRAEELQAILDAATETIWLLDAEGRILAANATGAERLGMNIAETQGKRYYDALPSVVAASRRERIEEVMHSGLPARFEDEFAGLVLEHTVYPVRDSSGAVTGVSVFSHDITERKQTEEREREMEAHKLEFYQRTILAATSGKLFITDRSMIEKTVGAVLASWDFKEAADLEAIRLAAAELVRSVGVHGNRLHGLVSYAGEALSNAVKYAHGGQAAIYRKNGTLYFVVSDHGPGIETLNLPDVALVDGYTTGGTLSMGYKLMMGSVDRVYLATGPDGTTVAGELAVAG